MKRLQQMISVIFIGGVHGVGKTTFCQSLANITSYTHVTASQLIKEKNAATISENTKLVKDVDYNQKLLIAAVKERREVGQKLILDGHFTLQTANGIQKIDLNVYQNLLLDTIAILTEDPDVIVKRIEQRDKKHSSVIDIANQQLLEISYAEAVASSLGVLFHRLSPDDESLRILASLLNSN